MLKTIGILLIDERQTDAVTDIDTVENLRIMPIFYKLDKVDPPASYTTFASDRRAQDPTGRIKRSLYGKERLYS